MFFNLILCFCIINIFRKTGISDRIGVVFVVSDGRIFRIFAVIIRRYIAVLQQGDILFELIRSRTVAILIVVVDPFLGYGNGCLLILIRIVYVELSVRDVDRTRNSNISTIRDLRFFLIVLVLSFFYDSSFRSNKLETIRKGCLCNCIGSFGRQVQETYCPTGFNGNSNRRATRDTEIAVEIC